MDLAIAAQWLAWTSYSLSLTPLTAARCVAMPWLVAVLSEGLGVATRNTYWHGFVAHLGEQVLKLGVAPGRLSEEDNEAAIRPARDTTSNHHFENLVEKVFLREECAFRSRVGVNGLVKIGPSLSHCWPAWLSQSGGASSDQGPSVRAPVFEDSSRPHVDPERSLFPAEFPSFVLPPCVPDLSLVSLDARTSALNIPRLVAFDEGLNRFVLLTGASCAPLVELSCVGQCRGTHVE